MVGLPGRALSVAVARQEQLSSGLVQFHRSVLQRPTDVKAMAKPAQLKARRCWGSMLKGTPSTHSSALQLLPHQHTSTETSSPA